MYLQFHSVTFGFGLCSFLAGFGFIPISSFNNRRPPAITLHQLQYAVTPLGTPKLRSSRVCSLVSYLLCRQTGERPRLGSVEPTDCRFKADTVMTSLQCCRRHGFI